MVAKPTNNRLTTKFVRLLFRFCWFRLVDINVDKVKFINETKRLKV
ncbi:MAG: hypothetical protein ACTS7I_01455 [Candidatus Hodgkinia cicadicola]